MAKGAYVGIPTSYTPVEYIESTGTQYIKTGIMQSDIGKVEAQAYNTFGLVYSNKTYGGSLFGARVSSTDSVFQYASGADDDFVGNGTSQISPTKNTNTDLLTLNYTKTSYLITCGNYSASGSLNVTIATPKEAYIFGLNNNGTFSAGTWKIKTFKMYNSNNELIRDFIPVLDYNNVACLYDQVEGKFYYNQGTGTFTVGTAGTPVSIGNRARKTSKMYVGVSMSYTPVEYIEGTGTQYIDTNFKPNNNTRVVFDFTPTSVTGTWSWPFGGRNAYHDADYTVAFNSSTWYSGFGGADIRPTPAPTANTRYLVDKDKNIIKINGSSSTNTAATFQSIYSLLLLGAHTQRNRGRPL